MLHLLLRGFLLLRGIVLRRVIDLRRGVRRQGSCRRVLELFHLVGVVDRLAIHDFEHLLAVEDLVRRRCVASRLVINHIWGDLVSAEPCRFQVLPRRWVAERTFAWLGQTRRLTKDYERLPDTAVAMILWAMSRIILRELAGGDR